MIGEAPGESEDFHGVPFYGVAGHILRTVLDYSRTRFLATITNTVCCRPTATDPISNRLTNRKPETSEQFLCLSHTQELLQAYKFDGVILFGEVADEYNKQFIKTTLPTLQLYHPAYIARLNYKLKPIREEGRKIQLWVKSLKTEKPFYAHS